MKKLDNLRQIIKNREFPKSFQEFGGANLIITDDIKRKHYEHDVVVYSKHAPELSWLVFELKEIYNSDIDYINKYAFYPSIGELMNNKLKNEVSIVETMIYIVDEIEKVWGIK
jgi:hypothetical protein